MKKIITLLLTFLAFNSILFAQKGPELSIAFLANDKIADVNINQETFINSVKEINDLTTKEFSTITENQKIAVLLICHKIGKPTIEIYSNPKLNKEIEKNYRGKLNSLKIENTKIVDFPMLFSINSKFEETKADFSDLVFPNTKFIQEYENASLEKKLEMNKKYAINEVLPVLAAYQTIVDDKFAGVKNFGKLVAKTNFSEKQDILKLTGNNSDYWRATMEMESGNQLIPVTKIFMLISQGELDHAIKYIEIVNMFSKSETYADNYLQELSDRLELFNKQLNSEIATGIAEHDKGNFEKATAIYSGILKQYPNSAYANFELFYSQSELNKKNGNENLNSIENWNKKKNAILDHNPFYGLPISSQNPEDAYLLSRRNSIAKLFRDKNEKLNDVYKYADIALDLKAYDFAAQLYWFSFTYSKNNEDSIFKLLYCIEKLGVTNLKQNFKGNFAKEFATIEKKKEKEMTNSEVYKSSQN